MASFFMILLDKENLEVRSVSLPPHASGSNKLFPSHFFDFIQTPRGFLQIPPSITTAFAP